MPVSGYCASNFRLMEPEPPRAFIPFIADIYLEIRRHQPGPEDDTTLRALLEALRIGDSFGIRTHYANLSDPVAQRLGQPPVS